MLLLDTIDTIGHAHAKASIFMPKRMPVHKPKRMPMHMPKRMPMHILLPMPMLMHLHVSMHMLLPMPMHLQADKEAGMSATVASLESRVTRLTAELEDAAIRVEVMSAKATLFDGLQSKAQALVGGWVSD